jgi:peptide/nickel transport system substrate-binding protein
MSKRANTRLARLSVGAVIAATGMTLAACAGGSSNPAASQQKDYSVLNLASSRPSPTWNPAVQLSALEDVWQWSTVYDTLLQCEDADQARPGAAQSFEINENNTQFTFKLREGMAFEDGTPIDSAVAKASIEHSQTGGGSVAGKLTGLTFETPDARTLVINSPTPQARLASVFCGVAGIIASPTALASADFSKPLSSGPYTYDAAASTSGSVLTFVKRDGYWDAKSYPYSKLVINVMPDVTARLNAFQTGQIDGAILNGQTVAAAKSAGLTISEWTDAVNGLMLFDRDGKVVPALRDTRVRQALNMVFDREAIAKGLFQGLVKPTSQMFDIKSDAYIPELDQRYKFDVEGAKRLMAEAGFADGFTVQIPSRSPQTDQANPLIIQQLAKLNIKVEEVPLAASNAVPELLSGRFPMTYLSLPLAASSVGNVEQSIQPNAPWNVLDNQVPELTAMTEKIQTVQGEELSRTAKDINTYVVDNAWFVPWNLRQAYFATSKDVTVKPLANPPFNMPQLRDFS